MSNNNHSHLTGAINDSILVKTKILTNDQLLDKMATAIQKIVECFSKGAKVLVCGNGGSAADAQHIAAELSGRFYYDRPPLAAEALHVNSSMVTAVANDYGFDFVFARMVEALGRKGDVLIAISTSGNSSNIIKAVESAKKTGMTVIGMTGESGGSMKDMCDVILNVPSSDTPRIQESHILLGHIICEQVEKTIFPKESGLE
jgi:D-sedoheptulose 7-phosphate isomerase